MTLELTELEVRDIISALQNQAQLELKQGFRKLGDDLMLLAIKIKNNLKKES